MICRGVYTWGFFHRWGKWETEERETRSEFIAGSTAYSPVASSKTVSIEFFQFKQCSKCGKRKGKKIA